MSSSTTTIQKRCTSRYANWLVGNAPWRGVLSVPEAGRRRKGRAAAVHRRSIGLRENAHHQLSRLLVGKYAVLSIESLNVACMDQLPHQAKAIRDAAIGGLLQKIRYKADWYGTVVVEADRFYPSSKLCSDCGAHNAALGREPYWTCSDCGVRHDRNENAALNLLTLAINAARDLPKLALGPVGPDVNAPGREGSGQWQ